MPGQLALGDTEQSHVPSRVPIEVQQGLELEKNRIVQIACGGQHTLLLLASRKEVEAARSRKVSHNDADRRKTIDPSAEENARGRKRRAPSPATGTSGTKTKATKRRRSMKA